MPSLDNTTPALTDAYDRYEHVDLARHDILATRVTGGARLTLFTDKQRVSAWLLVQAVQRGPSLSAADVFKFLAPLDLVLLDEAFSAVDAAVDAALEERPSAPFLVAKGREPVHGRDSQCQWHVENPELPPRARLLPDGGVDHRQGRHYVLVQAGDKLFTVTPPEAGLSGLDVHGREIKAYQGQWNRLLAGENTYAEGACVFALREGCLRVRDGKINVVPLISVSDVDYATGHIDFDGEVLVSGEVLPQFRVKARTLDARCVNRGIIDIREDLDVLDSFFGDVAQPAFVHGNARMSRARNVTLYGGGNIEVTREAVACELHALGRLAAPRAALVGGFFAALCGIEVLDAGSREFSRQTLCVRADKLHAPALHALHERQRVARENVEKIHAALAPYAQAPETASLSGTQREALVKLARQLAHEQQAMAQAQQQLKAELARLAPQVQARIVVWRRAYAGTRLELGEAALELTQNVDGPVRFVLDETGREILRERDFR